MSKIITVRPKKNTKKFFSNATQFQKVKGPDGKERSQEAGAYKGERFPNSKQMFRPQYSSSKRRWLLDGIENNGEELNVMVKACKLKYPKDHPNRGQYIEEADIFDFSDPFFSHNLLKVTSKEGEITINPDHPMDRLLHKAMISDPQFQVGAGTGSLLSSRVKYVITDRNMELKARKSKRSKKMKAYKLFEALDFKKKIKIGTAMGLILGGDIDPDKLDELLFEAFEDDKTRIDGKITKQDMFVSLCESTSEQLNLKHKIGLARKQGLIRKNKDGYVLFGQVMGRTLKDVESYVIDPNHQDLVLRMEQALEDNDSGN